MKLRVTLTRQPNFDVGNLDFLTEALPEDSESIRIKNELISARKKLDELIKKRGEVMRNYSKACDDLSAEKDPEKKVPIRKNINQLEAEIDKLNNEIEAATRNYSDLNQALANHRVEIGKARHKEYVAGRKAAAGGAAGGATNKFIEIMEIIGNSIAGVFKWIVDQLRNLPALASRILNHVKTLWGKIKGWMSKFHIVDRARSFSKLTIACVGFVALTVANWIYKVIFKVPDKYKANIDDFRSKMSTNWQQFKNPTTETAVFIETFGEILREDSNGGMLITMARKFIKRGKKIADDVCIACRDSTNRRLKNFVNTLRTLVYGSSEALEDGSTAAAENTIPIRFRRRLYNETAFDDSLESFYDSIILEAQAHKLRSIRKKAIKKVALKNAKRSLKG